MNRLLHIGGILLLVSGPILGSDQKAPKEPPPAAAKAPAPKGGIPKAGIPKGAARLVNPANPVTQLFRMTPEQRERLLEKAGPKQRQNARELLGWFDALPKDQQEIQIRRAEHFSQLAPEKKLEVMELQRAANQLPPFRKRMVRQTLFRLQQMSDQEREDTLHRPMFQRRFAPEDLKIIVGLADVWMGPIQQ